MKAAFTKSREEIAEVNAGLENSIAGIRVTRAYTGAEHETWKFERQNQRFVSARSAAYKIHGGVYHRQHTVYGCTLLAGVGRGRAVFSFKIGSTQGVCSLSAVCEFFF